MLWGCFVNFLVIFVYIWVEIVFLKGLVSFREIKGTGHYLSPGGVGGFWAKHGEI